MATVPNAPTLINPLSGYVYAATSQVYYQVTFAWRHNPTDEAAQTGAEVRYRKTSDTTWTTLSVGVDAYKEAALAKNNEYIWQVRTRGDAIAGYGPWSETRTFSIYDPPSLTVDEPSATITDMPINYTLTYTDNAGSFAEGTLKVYEMNGGSIGGMKYSEWLTGLSGSITTDEFLPETGKTYMFLFDVTSSTTLTASAYTTQAVSMAAPRHGTLTATNDAQTGYTSLAVGWDNTTGSTAAVSASLYRVVGNDSVLLASGLTNPSTFVDRYAPLNVSYTYQVVTFANSGAFYVKEFTNKIVTDRWFAIWGGGAKSAWAEWNPTGSYKLTRPQKKRVHYVGREYPVSYDGTALDETHNITFTVVDMDSWSNGFIQLMHDGGRGVYKSVDGKVFWADFEITNTPKYTSITRIGTVNLEITRIDGDAV